MALGKQAKILTPKQVQVISSYLSNKRNSLRDQLIFLLSVKAGLRAKEIACLKWSMVLNPENELSDSLALTNQASKGRSGRIIPINRDLKQALDDHLRAVKGNGKVTPEDYIIRTERRDRTSPQVIVNKFQKWYQDLGFIGCSSHSGRRTAITFWARRISTVGGSIRDVQILAGHSALGTTQRYIDADSEAQRKVVALG